jgi:hypothetical protein
LVAVVFFAVEVFLAGALVAVVFFAVDVVFAAVFFAVPPLADFLAVVEAADNVSFGSFLAPETTAFRSAPALNFGIAVFFALMRSPVRGC